MTDPEYQQWMQSLIRTLPEARNWLNRSEDPEGTADAWYRAMASVPLEPAMDALDVILAGDIDKPQFGWSDLPKIVIAYCRAEADRELAETRHEYHDTDGCRVRCQYCQDCAAGFVVIWNPWFVRDCGSNLHLCHGPAEARDLWRAWRNSHHGFSGMSCTAACCCESPGAIRLRQSIVEWQQANTGNRSDVPKATVIFDPDRLTAWHRGHPCEIRREAPPEPEPGEVDEDILRRFGNPTPAG